MSVDITFETEMEVNIECNYCGSSLNATFGEYSSGPYISVNPCDSCEERKYDEGYRDGKVDGYEEGYEDGYREGGDMV